MPEFNISAGLSDHLRLRELAKYYGARTLSRPSSHFDVEQAKEDVRPKDFELLPPRLSVDENLTALAQLAVSRLRCQRAFISLIDDEFQHILAEATQSISTSDLHDHAPGDGLLIGAQSLPLGFGFCPKTMKAFLEDDDLSFQQAGNAAGKDYVLIQDVTTEVSMRDCSAVSASGMSLRYYLEVPLRADAGHVVGSLCVTDDKPSFPQGNDVQRLQEIGKLVVNHLQSTRMQQDYHRAEQLLEGLVQFNLGQASISKLAKPIPDGNTSASFLTTSGQPDQITTKNPDQSSRISTISPSSSSEGTASAVVSHHSQTSLSANVSIGSLVSQESLPSQSAERDASTAEIRATSDVHNTSEPMELISAESVPTSVTTAVCESFSRAANLIRESMELDAVCFLEVPQNERFKIHRLSRGPVGATRASRNAGLSNVHPHSVADFSDSDECEDGVTPTNIYSKSSSPVICYQLGFSTRTGSSVFHGQTAESPFTVSANLLGRLAAKYPEGNIFHFDKNENVSAQEGLLHGTKSHDKTVDLEVHLSVLFPEARSLIFYPLYDNDNDHIYAGFLGYTSNPARALQDYEITYVSGFANSIMCKVMRLETEALDGAKSNFISSISHELRSPLHGILGAAEVLTENEYSPDQAEYVQMIISCARTLTDTVDHLLDHAKINQFSKRQAAKRQARSRKHSSQVSDPQPETYSIVSDVDLLSTIEETLLSVVGNTNQKLFSRGWQVPIYSTISAQGDQKAGGNVPVILDIKQGLSWKVKSEAGSWRRIIMNLVGNALKYTDKGYIEVRLLSKTSTAKKDSFVELQINDTGRGISEGYLKHRLYTSFAQEDNLSAGAGLGLSLVRQIVSSLNGEIEIQSEVGTGTRVKVQIPIKEPLRDDFNPLDTNLLALTQSKTFCFCGFNEQPPLAEQPTGVITPYRQALICTKNALSNLLVDWFGMKLGDRQGLMYVIQDDVLERELERYDQSGNFLLVVDLYGRHNAASKIHHAKSVHVSLPIGPIRMSQALQTLLAVQKKPSIRGQSRPSSPESPPGTSMKPKDAGTDLGRTPGLTHQGPSNTLPSDDTKSAVLLVDDNDINLRLLVNCVERLQLPHLSYITATNGREALDKYISCTESGMRIPLIFMDISMPIMDGLISTQEIRAFEKRFRSKKKVQSKIVALTGLSSAEARNEIISSGCDLYFRKPMDFKAVRKLLENCV